MDLGIQYLLAMALAIALAIASAGIYAKTILVVSFGILGSFLSRSDAQSQGHLLVPNRISGYYISGR